MMKQNKPVWVFIVMMIVIMVITRLPLLDNGYGTDDDSWSMARVAHQLAETGRYEASRLPSYPTQMILSALVWRGGPLALNGLSAFFCLLSAISLGLIAHHFDLKNIYLPSLMFIFSAGVYVASVTTIDYLFATGFFLISLYLVLKRQWVLAGICLGFSAGARITSGGFLLPYAVYIYLTETRQRRWFAIGLFTLFTLLTSALCYLPAFITYRAGFFYFNEKVILVWYVLRGITMDLLGSPGLIAVLAASLSMALAVWRLHKSGQLSVKDRLLLWVCGGSMALTLLLFIRVPHETAYLIPILPFLYLLIERFSNRLLNAIALVTLVISCFFTIGPASMAKGKLVPLGPLGIYQNGVLFDYAERQTFTRFIDQARQRYEALPEKKALVVGFYQSRYFFDYPGEIGQNNMYYSLDDAGLRQLLDQGYTVYSLPDLYHRLPANALTEGKVVPLFTADFADTRRAIHRQLLAENNNWPGRLLYNDY